MNDLIIKFKNSLNAFPKHLQEIRYFQNELSYGDLPSQFFWIDLEDYFNIFENNV
jgi:hypothetical protein